MKTRKLISSVLAILMLSVFISCEEQPSIETGTQTILPERFKVDIPNSMSDASLKSRTLKSSSDEGISGNDVYGNLTYFIALGENGAEMVQSIIWHIALYDIQDVLELTYTGDDDNRVKHLVVKSDITFNNRDWDYMLTITDLENEMNEDGGIGMQVFWNSDPIEGIALLKPANINVNEAVEAGDAMVSLEYSEKMLGEYSAHMIVEIADMPLADPSVDQFSVDNIKMFVGKKGDMVDVYGNSNHPNAKFFTEDTGFNWAFVASGNEAKDVAVAEVALPPSALDITDREVLLKDYSIKNVLTAQITTWFENTFGIKPDAQDLSEYLQNADAPGFFDTDGFIQGGTAPNDNYGDLVERLNNLSPYNPAAVSSLSLQFMQ